MIDLHLWAITLQIVLDDLFPTGSEIQGVEVATPYLPYVGLAVLIVLAFLGWRVYKNFSAFPNDDEERIGKVNFVWMGHYKFTGNVSRWTEPLDETQLEFLEQDPKYSEGISKILDLVHQKKLFVYQIRLDFGVFVFEDSAHPQDDGLLGHVTSE